ncbi:MAG: aldo/keto reductase [Chthoniobacterales bacterium]|nr:aldo/keto reductase [Chthoniobacterales bacterium]
MSESSLLIEPGVETPANTDYTRRNFVKLSAAAGIAAGVARKSWAVETRSGIPYRTLGSTGERVSLIGIGGSHIGRQKEDSESIEIIRAALDHGINFLDNSWDYNGGASEERMGKALRDGYRKKAFLMTKFDGRTKSSAEKQINESLERLQTDHVDLLQFHEIVHEDDPDRIFAKGGAVEAMIAAHKAGKTRYVGFTGHKDPAIHLKMLRVADAHGFKFDTVQLPLNAMDAHFNSFEKAVLPELVRRKIGVLGMKTMGDQLFLKSDTATPIEYLHYTMNLPTDVVITGCDSMKILQQAIGAAKSFQPLSPEQVAAILAKTAPVAGAGKFERYKTSTQFDSTTNNPAWLG